MLISNCNKFLSISSRRILKNEKRYSEALIQSWKDIHDVYKCDIYHFEPHMGHPGSVISADEKYKVAGLGLLRGNGSADVVKR